MCELKMTNNPCKYCNGEIDEGKYAQIPLEEYERLMKENGVLRKINKVQDEILERKMIAVVEEVNGGVAIIYMNKDGSIKRIEKR